MMLSGSGTRGVGIGALLLGLAPSGGCGGCGDGPICPSEISITIDSPASGATVAGADDETPAEPGIQIDVPIRSNLRSGSEVMLVVTHVETEAVTTYEDEVDGDGDAVFTGVTVPAGAVNLEVVTDGKCGQGSDSANISVVTDGLCELRIAEQPIANDFYAPLPVLNSTNDSDPDLPHFQANLEVSTGAGFEVEVFVLDVNSGTETSAGVMSADNSGSATYALTLDQGVRSLRATCIRGEIAEASATNTVVVDTVVPTCELTVPADGVTVTPDDDVDDGADGIQMVWTGTVDGGDNDDVEGELTTFLRGNLPFEGTAVDASGEAMTDGNAEFTSPGTFEVSFQAQDHAANPCVDSRDVPVIMDGCSIMITSPSTTPSTPVTADSDGTMGNGLQTDIEVAVGTECEGQMVSVECCAGASCRPVVTATVPAGGATTVSDVTLDTSAAAQGMVTCTASVSNTADFETSDAAVVHYDSLAPTGNLEIVRPGTLECGEQIVDNMANDVDDTRAGFQIDVRPATTFADFREIELTTPSGTCTGTCVCPTGQDSLPECDGSPFTNAPTAGSTNDIRITLEGGENDIRAVFRDLAGNESRTGPCPIVLTNVALSFNEPVSTGNLGAGDGVVNGDGDLEITVCGTVSDATAELTLTVDGGQQQVWSPGSTDWCTPSPVVLPEGGPYAIQVDSTGDAGFGTITQNVTVDLTDPDEPTSLTVTAPVRNAIDLFWLEPGGGVDRYEIRYSLVPFTNNTDGFESEGIAASPQPLAGTNSYTIEGLLVGVDYYVGIQAIDAAGNRSPALLWDIEGSAMQLPVTPLFDQTGPINAPANPTNCPTPTSDCADGRALGAQVVSGNFNGDAYDDVALSAPLEDISAANDQVGRVYIYHGGPDGVDDVPDVIIDGTGSFAFGYSMTRLDWTGNGDGLAIGSQFDNSGLGSIYIFHNAILSGGGSLNATNANMTIRPAATGWFSGGGFATSLASGPVDTAGSLEDLIVGVTNGGGGLGGVAILYGGTAADGNDGNTTIDVIDSNASEVDGYYFELPASRSSAADSFLGSTVAYLGDTRNGDGVGDIGVGFFDVTGGPATTADNAVYVLRGRTVVPDGIEETSFAGSDCGGVCDDLEIENGCASDGACGDSTLRFGERMGSIENQGGTGLRDIVITSPLELNGRVYVVNGGATGLVTITNGAGYVSRLTGASGARFGTAVANNAIAPTAADVDGDGNEDLVVAGLTGADVAMHIWYGGTLPVTGTSATAGSVVAAPAAFTNAFTEGLVTALTAVWVGDSNDDGLTDICWADHQVEYADGTSNNWEGAFEVLWDDGVE